MYFTEQHSLFTSWKLEQHASPATLEQKWLKYIDLISHSHWGEEASGVGSQRALNRVCSIGVLCEASMRALRVDNRWLLNSSKYNGVLCGCALKEFERRSEGDIYTHKTIYTHKCVYIYIYIYIYILSGSYIYWMW